ncbi:MAG: aminotransferase class I/II-fold pyridoxal phosphate-dependent enzyme [Terriglobales bacterium]|jgi:histidinol-phosphate aminotransferase
MANRLSLPSASRRSFLSLSAAASAALALRIVTEPMLAYAARESLPRDGVKIDANENPLGPAASAREALAAILPQGGRYSFWLTDDLVKTLAEMEGLKVEQVRLYPGSSEPLHHAVAVFASPQRSYVTADPGYEAGMIVANAIGAKVVKVPLTKTYAHDVKAMLAAAPEAGAFYVCTPNNPTGTLTGNPISNIWSKTSPRIPSCWSTKPTFILPTRFR